jgi:hypothetical protein
MIPIKLRYLLLCAPLAACGDKPPKPPALSEALPNLPLPPGASLVSVAGGSEALQVTVRSPAKPDVVAAYYRGVLQTGGWKLVSDAKDPGGAIVLFAQQSGPPLWVRIEDAGAGSGTLIQLSGAVVSKVDSAKAKAAS